MRAKSLRRISTAAVILTATVVCTALWRRTPLIEAEVTLYGHSEVVLEEGIAMARFLDDDSLGVCLRAPASTDTGRWQARLSATIDAASPTWTEPVKRLGTTVCFAADLPPRVDGREVRGKLCGLVRDAFDGREMRLPCQPFYQTAKSAAYEALGEARDEAMTAILNGDLESGLARLDEVRRSAAAAGFHLLAVRAQLIAVHYLFLERRFAEIRQALAAMPPWLSGAAAAETAARTAWQNANLGIYTDGPPARVWHDLERADDLFRRVAHSQWLAVAMSRGELLARMGAVRHGVTRLATAIADCDRGAPCGAALLPYAKGTLAWLILLDSGAGPEELRLAEKSLQAALAGITARGDPFNHANHLINLAYLRVLQPSATPGGDPLALLRKARQLSKQEDAAFLRGWASLVEGLAALADGNPALARRLCRAVREGESSNELAAWAASCAGRAHRHGGDLEHARQAFAEALLAHEALPDRAFGQGILHSPSHRADDFYRAARVAVELGAPEEAWRLLARLDALTIDKQARRECREQITEAAVLERWQDHERRIQHLLKDLMTLDERSGGTPGVRRTLQEELHERVRSWPGCAPRPTSASDAGLRLRAFAVDDEVLLLERHAGGPRLARRTTLPRAELHRLLNRLSEVRASRDLDDDAWRQLLSPLAAALVPPEPSTLPAVTLFALHGVLQDVPLAALPLADGWLSEHTTVARRPAGVRPPVRVTGPPIFVVDPRGNLPSGIAMADFYRRRFPAARVAAGEAATRRLLEEAAGGARWLHIDAHGRYDAAFPELSHLELADGAIALFELAALAPPAELANLSGCQTGRWPVTAGRGEFGIAGSFARRGTAWVVASRNDLSDRLAEDFNRPFYAALAAGEPVPRAFASALAAVRSSHPAAGWSALLLLRGADRSRSSNEAENSGGPTAAATAARRVAA